ncbi:hypothetical protein FH972_026466 [Carpinus fangiana]|uniref:Uncharacterized protein n=1 Tax=Carpinus fangiana TaxID=176857 RepID=A0A5N6L515_9ROSI|nr:hypothetical protein FH972_026466 [Carpinus fangiana]
MAPPTPSSSSAASSTSATASFVDDGQHPADDRGGGAAAHGARSAEEPRGDECGARAAAEWRVGCCAGGHAAGPGAGRRDSMRANWCRSNERSVRIPSGRSKVHRAIRFPPTYDPSRTISKPAHIAMSIPCVVLRAEAEGNVLEGFVAGARQGGGGEGGGRGPAIGGVAEEVADVEVRGGGGGGERWAQEEQGRKKEGGEGRHDELESGVVVLESGV